MKTILLTCIGVLFLVLGAIGLVLPVWPTTPFVLVSVACFSSAPKIKARIMNLYFFKDHIENYEHRKGLPQKTFWLSMGWLWGMLLISIILIHTVWISLLLIFIGLAVSSHILWMSKAKGRKRSKTE